MKKRLLILFALLLGISTLSYGIDAWIRVNRLGYLPNGGKKAVFMSKSPVDIKQFGIYDVLTNALLETFTSVVSKEAFEGYESIYVLDFSKFNTEGAFYLKAGLVFSPTIYINKNIYLGKADFLLKFLRESRNNKSFLDYEWKNPEEAIKVASTPASSEIKTMILASSGKIVKRSINPENGGKKYVDVLGGWLEGDGFTQHAAISATVAFQLMFAYLSNPASFTDQYNAYGEKKSDGFPDVLNEAKWGLDWLLKMTPEKNVVYSQVGNEMILLSSSGSGRPVYAFTDKTPGGVASLAGKYASAFGLGAEVFSSFLPVYADSLKKKALELYALGKKHTGVYRLPQELKKRFPEEDNWKDDMELAAAQLYRLTYDGNFLTEAAGFGRTEPVSPWMCSDTARHYQWYPFINLGHCILANVENPRYRNEFSRNWKDGLQRMKEYAAANPFNIGIPLIRNSNNLTTALATQCRLYRSLTNDSTYINMENSLVDWLLGCNPWGTLMLTGLDGHKNNVAALRSGPVHKSVYNYIYKNATPNPNFSKSDQYDYFQSDWAVYHESPTDSITAPISFDGTASLIPLLSAFQQDGTFGKTSDKNEYQFGTMTRADKNKKQISLVFIADRFTDGYKSIQKTLKKTNVKASFFFTTDFYQKASNKQIIKTLLKDGHYLGLQVSKGRSFPKIQKADTLPIEKETLLSDLREGYTQIEKFGLSKNAAPFVFTGNILNDSISEWCRKVGLEPIAFSPGTLSEKDITTPDMRENYFSSHEIYNKILDMGSKQNLNGAILQFHLGAGKQRQDKFYPKLGLLLTALSKSGYEFTDLYKTTDLIGKNIISIEKKQKRKN